MGYLIERTEDNKPTGEYLCGHNRDTLGFQKDANRAVVLKLKYANQAITACCSAGITVRAVPVDNPAAPKRDEGQGDGGLLVPVAQTEG